MTRRAPALPWLEPGQAFPPLSSAWGAHDPAPGLLAAGGALNVTTLVAAYSQGIFPWYSEGQPILWWSPDPRMVLQVARFRFHRSLRQTLKRCWLQPGFALTFDRDFSQVIRRCSASPRR